MDFLKEKYYDLRYYLGSAKDNPKAVVVVLALLVLGATVFFGNKVVSTSGGALPIDEPNVQPSLAGPPPPPPTKIAATGKCKTAIDVYIAFTKANTYQEVVDNEALNKQYGELDTATLNACASDTTQYDAVFNNVVAPWTLDTGDSVGSPPVQ